MKIIDIETSDIPTIKAIVEILHGFISEANVEFIQDEEKYEKELKKEHDSDNESDSDNSSDDDDSDDDNSDNGVGCGDNDDSDNSD
tara:strand:- start:44 stop:301 length:258 start_codon:yes stop_codon:yes gene_type:complete